MNQMSMFAGVTARKDRQTDWRAPLCLPQIAGKFKRLFADTETTGKNPFVDRPVGMSGATDDGQKFYLPWGHAGGGNLDEDLVRRWARRELRDIDIWFANAKFDIDMFVRWGVDLEAQGCRVHDIAFGPALLDERRRRFNLDLLAQDFLGRTKDRELSKEEKSHIADMPAAVVGPYAEEDAVLLRDLEAVIRPRIDAEDLGRVLDLEDSIIYAVAYMERQGVLIDRPKLERWITEVETEYTRMMYELARRAGFRCNPDSNTDMQRLFSHLGLVAPVSAETHNPSFEGMYLKTIPNEVVQLALRARKQASLLSKYLRKYVRALDSNNILRFSLHQLRGDEKGTVSGRFACAAPDSGGANIQQVMKAKKQIEEDFNVDHIIRELFIPAPGMTWVSADAAQIEFRLFAHYSNSPKLIGAYAKNPQIDFHNIVLDIIQKIMTDFSRGRAKTINFAKLYGAQPPKIAEQMGLALEDALKFIEVYDAEFPEAGNLMRAAQRIAQTRGWVKTYLGRRARFIKPTSRDAKIRMMEEIAYKPHSALNRVLQGTAADIMKIKIKAVYDAREYLEMVLRMTVHDEVDGDMANPDKTTALAELLNDQCLPLKVPILWEVESGANWRLGKGEV